LRRRKTGPAAPDDVDFLGKTASAGEKKPTAKGRRKHSAHFRGPWQNLRSRIRIAISATPQTADQCPETASFLTSGDGRAPLGAPGCGFNGRPPVSERQCRPAGQAWMADQSLWFSPTRPTDEASMGTGLRCPAVRSRSAKAFPSAHTSVSLSSRVIVDALRCATSR
jgi:hypothetical protein